MLNFINEILAQFRGCFSREAAFGWFVTLVTGFMVRSDHLGVTSVIRDLGLSHGLYELMLHFYRASSWKLEDVRQKWYETVKRFAPIYHDSDNEETILIGDGVKQPKEARRMPGVKKMVQESEDSSKAQYIFGHMFGGLGVLIGNAAKRFCLPISIRLHDGLQFKEAWDDAPGVSASHVVKMVEDGFQAAKTFGKSVLLLDRYFLSAPALQRLAELNAGGSAHLEIVTKAKRNCVAYHRPEKKIGRGRPAKKGAKVVLKDLFCAKDTPFQKAVIELYGKMTEVEYCCVDLLWGQKLYRELRFVLVKYGSTQSILVSTSLEYSPERIIRLYSYRFRIEGCFRELKQQIGGFCYRFWTSSMPKLNHFPKKDTPDPLQEVIGEKQRTAIWKAVKAIERYVMLACIAMGIIQMLALKFAETMSPYAFRYLRTPSSSIPSEATVMCYLQKKLFHLMFLRPDLPISRFILRKSDLSCCNCVA